jgi:hypothetical protein
MSRVVKTGRKPRDQDGPEVFVRFGDGFGLENDGLENEGLGDNVRHGDTSRKRRRPAAPEPLWTAAGFRWMTAPIVAAGQVEVARVLGTPGPPPSAEASDVRARRGLAVV